MQAFNFIGWFHLRQLKKTFHDSDLLMLEIF
jgi:hypothetical protein